jgi:integrase
MLIGDYSHAPNTDYMRERSGGALGANSKAHHIGVLRTFFVDLQEWEWIERRFDPRRVLAVPRSVAALIGPEPRVIADDVWAKLLWAGLNLTSADLPAHASNAGEPWYPLELVRTLALLWLFGGLRNDEIVRLRVGAIRWQQPGAAVTNGDGTPVCLLDVPTNKTGTSFTKPVDRVVGEAIERWEAVRAPQPQFVDAKTAETVDFLFAHRGARIGRHYINRTLIGLLCAKAGVPRSDVRGSITSHRGRATIASQLYNAKQPLSLFELQAWLGHRSPESTRHYAQITPTTLSKAYTDAGYFERNLRTIEVLLDRDAVESGAAASGEPFEFYDLGHGYCSYSFFEQCPHRMACARCDFYLPKESARGQLLYANTSLQRMLVEIPLSEEERGAVEDDERAVRRLLDRLADTPTPAGPTPRELPPKPTGRELPTHPQPRPGRGRDG